MSQLNVSRELAITLREATSLQETRYRKVITLSKLQQRLQETRYRKDSLLYRQFSFTHREAIRLSKQVNIADRVIAQHPYIRLHRDLVGAGQGKTISRDDSRFIAIRKAIEFYKSPSIDLSFTKIVYASNFLNKRMSLKLLRIVSPYADMRLEEHKINIPSAGSINLSNPVRDYYTTLQHLKILIGYDADELINKLYQYIRDSYHMYIVDFGLFKLEKQGNYFILTLLESS